MTNRGNYNSDGYLPSEEHTSITPEERYLWIKLPSGMKHVILKGRNSNNAPNNSFNSNKSNNPSCKTVKPPS